MLYLLLLVILCPFLNGQTLPGARQNAICNSDAALCDDVFSVFYNPAGTAQINWREAGIFYTPSPFGLTELATGYIAYTEPTAIGSFSAGFMNYGYELYHENNFLLSFSSYVLGEFYIGFSMNYKLISINNYGNTGIFYVNSGVISNLSDEINFGFYIYNLNRASIRNEDDQIPVLFNAGISYNYSDALLLHVAVNKDLRYAVSSAFGVEYLIFDLVSFRSGINTEPLSYSGGTGIHFNNFSFDYAFSVHQELGMTHQLSIIFSFPGFKNRQTAVRESGK
jgi:hypothetical protein